MWTWLALGWAGIAVLTLALVRHRFGRRSRVPRRTRAFLEALRRAIAECCDGACFVGLVPGRFTGVIAVDGQETPIPLRPMQAHWEAFPSELGHVVARLVAEVRSEGLDRPGDFDFGELATDILPQIKTLAWLHENSPAFGEARIVHRALGEDLVVCYVIDDAWSMVFVCEAHLRRWRLGEDDLFGLARRNLATRTDAATRARIASGAATVLRTDDGYAAARVLLLDIDDAPDLLVALPDRDVLWIGGVGDADLPDLLARSARECEVGSRPVSPHLYRLAAGALEPVG